MDRSKDLVDTQFDQVLRRCSQVPKRPECTEGAAAHQNEQQGCRPPARPDPSCAGSRPFPPSRSAAPNAPSSSTRLRERDRSHMDEGFLKDPDSPKTQQTIKDRYG